MKISLGILLVTLSLGAHAESELETDDSFFKGAAAPYEDDELDRDYKKNELLKTTEHQKKTETKVQSEFSETTQGIMPAYEARMMDEKIIAENKRREEALLSTIRRSSGAVHACIAKNAQLFEGTHATVIWMVSAEGTIQDMAIKDTDIQNTEIQRCIEQVAGSLDFSSAKTTMLKKTHVEYVYKFKKIVRQAPPAKPARKAAKKAKKAPSRGAASH